MLDAGTWWKWRPSELAAAALCIAIRSCDSSATDASRKEAMGDKSLESVTGMAVSTIETIAGELKRSITSQTACTEAISAKYRQKEYYGVAEIELKI